MGEVLEFVQRNFGRRIQKQTFAKDIGSDSKVTLHIFKNRLKAKGSPLETLKH